MDKMRFELWFNDDQLVKASDDVDELISLIPNVNRETIVFDLATSGEAWFGDYMLVDCGK